MLFEHIVFSSKAENALVRLAMVVELYDQQRFRVFQGAKQKLQLIKAAIKSRHPKVRQQLEIFRDQLNEEHQRALQEVKVDLWALPAVPEVGDVRAFEEAVQERLNRQRKLYRSAQVA